MMTRADSHILSNSTLISIRIVELLSNGLLVETSINNVIPENVSLAFNPECLSFNVQNSTLLVLYNARIPENALIKSANAKEIVMTFDEELSKCIQLFIVFITGSIILVLERLSSKTGSKNNLKKTEGNKVHYNNPMIDEKSLLMLSSKDPETYRKTIDMILKGELRVKRRRFGKMLSKIRKFVNFRRLFLL